MIRSFGLIPLALYAVATSILLAQEPASKAPPAKEEANWKPLFDGKTLEGWKKTPFGGEGDVYVEEGKLILDQGASMTGVTREKEFPKSHYELRWEAARLDGNDFFCGCTFPVQESHCSLIAGGWGGTVVGLSSIDGLDASENSTGQYMEFVNGRWYKFRVRVTDKKIVAWINDKQVIEQELEGKRINTRIEVDLNKPLGFATWDTKGALRNIEYRTLEKDAK
jgi:hypothetical protein